MSVLLGKNLLKVSIMHFLCISVLVSFHLESKVEVAQKTDSVH